MRHCPSCVCELRGGDEHLAQLMQGVAQRHAITPAAMAGRSRVRELVQAREEFSWRARDDGYPLKAIGRALGGRHHTTVINLLQNFERKLLAAESGRTPTGRFRAARRIS